MVYWEFVPVVEVVKPWGVPRSFLSGEGLAWPKPREELAAFITEGGLLLILGEGFTYKFVY